MRRWIPGPKSHTANLSSTISSGPKSPIHYFRNEERTIVEREKPKVENLPTCPFPIRRRNSNPIRAGSGKCGHLLEILRTLGSDDEEVGGRGRKLQESEETRETPQETLREKRLGKCPGERGEKEYPITPPERPPSRRKMEEKE